MDNSSFSSSSSVNNNNSSISVFSSEERKKKKCKGKVVQLSTDPQSVAARERRHRISDRFKILQSLVPGGSKMDTVSMLDEAIHYVKFLKTQIWLHQAVINLADYSDHHQRLLTDHLLHHHNSYGDDFVGDYNNIQCSQPSNNGEGPGNYTIPTAQEEFSPGVGVGGVGLHVEETLPPVDDDAFMYY